MASDRHRRTPVPQGSPSDPERRARPRPSRVKDEERRLAVLHQRVVLDTASEQAFESIAALARDLCAVPVAGVAFLDRERNWFKAIVGADLQESPRDESFCRVAIERRETLAIGDLRDDPRFHDNPRVLGPPGLRAYAGAPVVLDDQALGTVCVFDVRVRRFTVSQKEGLTHLAQLAAVALVARTVRPRLSERLGPEYAMGDPDVTIDLLDDPDAPIGRLTRLLDLDGPRPAIAVRRMSLRGRH